MLHIMLNYRFSNESNGAGDESWASQRHTRITPSKPKVQHKIIDFNSFWQQFYRCHSSKSQNLAICTGHELVPYHMELWILPHLIHHRQSRFWNQRANEAKFWVFPHLKPYKIVQILRISILCSLICSKSPFHFAGIKPFLIFHSFLIYFLWITGVQSCEWLSRGKQGKLHTKALR